MNLKFLKLVSGEIILSEVEHNPEGKSYKLTKPVTVAMMQHPQDPEQIIIGMNPWPEYCEEETTILSAEHIMAQYQVPTDIENVYSTRFGSGIIQPDTPKGLITP